MNAKSLLKSSLKSLRKSCVKYKVGFDEILNELKGEEDAIGKLSNEILNELKDEENIKQKNGV